MFKFVDIVSYIGFIALIVSIFTLRKPELSKREHLITRFIFFDTLFNTVGWGLIYILQDYLTEERCLFNNNSGLIYELTFPIIVLALLSSLRFNWLALISFVIAYLLLVFLLPLGVAIDFEANYVNVLILMFVTTSIALGIYLLRNRNIIDISTIFIFLMALLCLFQAYSYTLECDLELGDCSAMEQFKIYYGFLLSFLWGLFIYHYGIRRVFK